MPDEYNLPQDLAGWYLVAEIGAGTSGSVWQALDPAGETAAIKILPGEDRLPTARLLAFLRSCPGMVTIRKAVTGGGCTFLVMDLLESFAALTAQRELTERERIAAMVDICQTLCCFAANGMVHQDIKPENILMDSAGHYVLGDVDEIHFCGEASPGSLRGSFTWMAPEVYRGEPGTHLSDLYSLGMVFYICSNRDRPPFTDLSRRVLNHHDMEQSLAARMQGSRLPAPADASPAFSRILLRLCEPEPRKRYPDAGTLLKDLERLQRGRAAGVYRLKAAVEKALWRICNR